MTLTKTKPRRPTADHKKRVGLHHHRGHHYLKTYWPYLPISATLAFGLMVNGWLGSVHRSVLGYATDMSVSSLLSDTNTQRANNNIGALALNAKLDAAAQAKASDMAARNYWSHNTPDGKSPWTFFVAAGYQYQTAGENLAYGFNTASDTLAGWMNSPEHRANILNTTYKDVGFAIINIPDYQNTGAETLVVAMYASPAALPAPSANLTTASQPPATQPTVTVQPPAATVKTAPSTPKPKPSSAESVKPAATSASQHSLSPEPPTQQVARFQLIANNTSLNFFAIGIIGVVCFAFLLLRHSLAWHRRLIRGERFILRHTMLDLTAAVIIGLSIILGHTAGLIR